MAHDSNIEENAIKKLQLLVPPHRRNDPTVLASIQSVIEFSNWLVNDHPDKASFKVRLRELDQDARAMVMFALGFGRWILRRTREAKTLPPSKGYHRLMNAGPDNTWVKLATNVAKRHGQRKAAEDILYGRIAVAIRFLAKRGRRASMLREQVEFLVRVLGDTQVLDPVLPEATQREFVKLLNATLDGGPTDQLSVRCAQLAKVIRPKRGPKISEASSTHQFLIEVGFAQGRSCTYSSGKEDFTDPFTAGTRQEFDVPDFNPRPAIRRARLK